MGVELRDYAAFVKIVIDAFEAVGVDYLTGGAFAVCVQLAAAEMWFSIRWMTLVKPLNRAWA